ncbi:MAG: type II secretion system protein, partial [Opitutales bacterium]
MSQKKPDSGFTLIELLVVIAIILIASSFIIFSGSGGGGAKLSSSQRIVSGIAQGARGQALLKNAKTLLIIHNDQESDMDKYRRYFGIVYWREGAKDAEGDPLPDGWIAGNQGTYLPQGIYFDPELSEDKSEGNWST